MLNAIYCLERALDVLRNNEPINRREGKIEQADLELEVAAEYEEAINALYSISGDRPLPGTAMRAKLEIDGLIPIGEFHEQLHFRGVCKSQGYGEDGLDEDNTFAKFSPSVNLDITIANPVLLGKFKVGQRFYVDFTQVYNAEPAIAPETSPA
jgi:hypothetical protein